MCRPCSLKHKTAEVSRPPLKYPMEPRRRLWPSKVDTLSMSLNTSRTSAVTLAHVAALRPTISLGSFRSGVYVRLYVYGKRICRSYHATNAVLNIAYLECLYATNRAMIIRTNGRLCRQRGRCEMVQCDSCLQWYHFTCAAYRNSDKDWFCKECWNAQ